ncbi:MAG: hypothetical protein WCT31_04730 [Candidatus Micrarchaeia archaeon]|jgi:hypothetical protein
MQLIPSLNPPSEKSCKYGRERYVRDIIAGIAIVAAYLLWVWLTNPRDSVGHAVFFFIGIIAGLPFYIYLGFKLLKASFSGLGKGTAVANAKSYLKTMQNEIAMDAEISLFGSPYFLLFFIPASIIIGALEPWKDINIAALVLVLVLSLNVEKLVLAHLFVGVKKK